MKTIILTYLIWILFALLSGYLESFYWSKVSHKQAKKYKYAHEFLTVIRGIVALPLVYWLYLYFSFQAIASGAAFMAMFPFFHDGMYYYQRNKLDDCYPLGWKDTSKTSTAKFTLNYKARLFLATFINLVLTLILFYK